MVVFTHVKKEEVKKLIKKGYVQETVKTNYEQLRLKNNSSKNNVTLILYDIYGNLGYDSVLIEILDAPAENTGNSSVIFISGILGILGIISIFRILKIR